MRVILTMANKPMSAYNTDPSSMPISPLSDPYIKKLQEDIEKTLPPIPSFLSRINWKQSGMNLVVNTLSTMLGVLFGMLLYHLFTR